MLPTHKQKKGFTLIELIIVIAIIATLSGAIFVALNPAKRLQDSRNAQRQTATVSILDAVKKYQADNEGALPTGIDSTMRMIGTATSGCDISCGNNSGSSAIQTIAVRVVNSNDDAEEQNPPNGSMSRNSSDLELVYDGFTEQLVGMRFRNIAVPQNATITSSTITFTTDETADQTTNLLIYGENTDDAHNFGNSNGDISNRTQTTARVAWTDVPAWLTIGETHETPDISTIIQEIIDRTGWNSGNDIVLIIEGTGRRTAESYNGSSVNAPLLTINYTEETIESTATACVDLTSPLSLYLPIMPRDPQTGTDTKSFYAIKTVPPTGIQVTACSAENNITIQSTR